MSDEKESLGAKDSQKPNNAADNATSASRDQIQPTPIHVPAALPELNQVPSTNSNAATEAKSNESYDAKDWLEVLGIIAGIVGVIVLIWQSFLLLQANKATRVAVKVSQDQSAVMHQQLMLDERAWVAVTLVKLDFSAEAGRDPVGVVFREEFRNTGKTPAINVTPVVGIYDDMKRIPKSDTFPNPVYTSMLLPPDASAEIPPTVGPDPAIYQAIKAGNPVYVAGTIWYDDIFGSNHWSQFCWQITPDFHAKPMAFHFSCDDAEANKSK